MVNKELWNKEFEKDFFTKSLDLASPEKLFYTTNDKKYFAYWPRTYGGIKTTLQSRNTLIGEYTEKWARELISDVAKKMKAHAISGVMCEELELTSGSPADVAICKTDDVIQKSENIIALFEVKMSIVWNWELIKNKPIALNCIGDYKTHQGNPGLLRSDSMLKAIGKSINVRTSSRQAGKIPIVVLGNTPIAESYYKKVDNLKRYGIIQGFWSLNPKPLDSRDSVKNTKGNGFIRFDNYQELEQSLLSLLKEEIIFFAGMKPKDQLGKLIEISDKEKTYEKKAEKFLELLGEEPKDNSTK